MDIGKHVTFQNNKIGTIIDVVINYDVDLEEFTNLAIIKEWGTDKIYKENINDCYEYHCENA